MPDTPFFTAFFYSKNFRRSPTSKKRRKVIQPQLRRRYRLVDVVAHDEPFRFAIIESTVPNVQIICLPAEQDSFEDETKERETMSTFFYSKTKTSATPKRALALPSSSNILSVARLITKITDHVLEHKHLVQTMSLKIPKKHQDIFLPF